MGQFYGSLGQIVCGLSGVLLSAFYVSMQIVSVGTHINYFFDVPYQTGVLLGYTCIVFYTYRGGIRAVMETDVVQYTVFFVALPLGFVALVHSIFGTSSFEYLLGVFALYLVSLAIMGHAKKEITLQGLVQYTLCFTIIPLAVELLL